MQAPCTLAPDWHAASRVLQQDTPLASSATRYVFFSSIDLDITDAVLHQAYIQTIITSPIALNTPWLGNTFYASDSGSTSSIDNNNQLVLYRPLVHTTSTLASADDEADTSASPCPVSVKRAMIFGSRLSLYLGFSKSRWSTLRVSLPLFRRWTTLCSRASLSALMTLKAFRTWLCLLLLKDLFRRTWRTFYANRYVLPLHSFLFISLTPLQPLEHG